ncbi:MAG: type IX secretion system membrane protein PorP/SprF [Flavobacteriales bacterium]|nr:type IX secretion system membrane protein PorP/SprF [Flavobacteriales bacterium]
MSKNRFFTLVAIFAFAFSQNAHAQDPAFSQFYGNPLYLNPAMTGSANCPRISLHHRNQWPNIKSSFVTNSISYDRHLNELKGGVGLQIVNDIEGEGALKNTQVSLLYSYQLQISRKFNIVTGIQASYQQRALDKSKLQFGDQIDPSYGFVLPTKENVSEFADNVGYADIALGVMAYSKKYFAGIAIHHLTEPEDAFIATSNLPRRFTLHAGTNFSVGKSRNLGLTTDEPYVTPNILYMSQNGARQLNIGMSLTNQSLSGGLYFRNNFSNSDALLLVLGYTAGGIRVGYSYDYTISELMGSSGGAHEVSLTIQLDCQDKRKKLKAIKCPKF